LSPASRPRLSLAPESFAPSAAHLHERSGGHFPDCQARAVLVPERFRGRLLLRRRTCVRALPRGHSEDRGLRRRGVPWPCPAI